MKITLRTYRPFDINKLAENVYTATLFGNPIPKTHIEEDGTESVEHEVDVYRSEILPAESLEEASEYVQQNFDAMVIDLSTEESYQKKLKAKEEAEQYLKSTDYRTLKAVREIPEVRAKLEELYPGEIDRNIKAAETAKAV